ncbi:GntR family transcriptional regulator [Microbacterium sp. No. 7]|uniref:GntR family transcriptional regulator n=1 Tax=Microbacterium sp. No. 7 TaxID=1714373 RepID=UPI0006CF65A0|nr:GntR family transcriptional regulator [Microbacterium sp. No. 7]ALJ22167.1 GntR family transcriptional regulator [Microbacterium sp. No. 7]
MELKTHTPVRRTPKRASLSDEIAVYIRELIMSGTIRPGEFVRLERITEAKNVSTTPVREALVSLAADGYVIAVPRRGFVAARFSRQDVRDLFWAQSQLAGELAARAAVEMSDADIERLETIMRECDDAAARGDGVTVGALGHQFHRIVNNAADSPRLAQVLAGMVKQFPTSFYSSIESNVRTASRDHHDIFEGIVARDSERARRAAAAHLTSHADHVVALLEERGLWSDEA